MTVFRLVAGVVAIGLLLWSGALVASAHEMTERYIPVGQSPGLSGKYTVIGTVRTVDARNRTVAVTGPTGTWTAAITERTKIWLDRSRLRLPNLTGTMADLRPGATVEVKHEGHRRGVFDGPADWIKVQIVENP